MSAIKAMNKKLKSPIPVIVAKDLPEFSEYVRRKYNVNLEKDLVVMIEDLIERQKTNECNHESQ